ncbi:hypothetical protein SDC9_147968 [bioreactor metagenome]|uniref:Uncharacterized protein n=1 Tax=bioreactor metagenome TaxID=1076179 RepID=A0A645EHH5_9ZZZZ
MHDAGRNQQHVAAPDRAFAALRQVHAPAAAHQHQLVEIVHVRDVVRLPEVEDPQRQFRQQPPAVQQRDSVHFHDRLRYFDHNIPVFDYFIKVFHAIRAILYKKQPGES